MNNKIKVLMCFASTILLLSCQPDTPEQAEIVKPEAKTQEETASKPTNFNEIFNQSVVELFRARPVSATVYGFDEALAGGKFNDRLADYSPVSEAKLRSSIRQVNQLLKGSSSSDPQTEENRLVMMNLNRYFAGHADFDIGYIDEWMGLSAFIVNQINGPLIDVPNTIVTNHSINNLEDAKDYLARLNKFDAFIGSVIMKVKADADKNWIAPKVIINKTINGLNSFIEPSFESHPLVSAFITKMDKLDNIDDDKKAQLVREVKQAVKNVVYPAYQQMIELQKLLLDKATDESGIWAQPNGAAFYADAVKMLGDTDLSSEEIHQLGLSEVDRITLEMDVILKSEGLNEGSVGHRMTSLNNDPQFLYEDSDAGREQLLSDLNGYIKEITDRMDEQFASIPPYEVEVRKFPAAREASAPGGMYTSPPLDGSSPGIYWINLRDIKANPKFDLKTLTYHEANPGHHWQVALNLAQNSLPMLRRIAPYNAYIEGWALYSEKVAKEMGMYVNDPYGDLGRLKAELFRAVRLVVDTGMHYKKWSREQAIKYMMETTGTVESDVVAEIERYMVWPGQALGYKLGMINMLKQRHIAQSKLGDKFDIKAFHDLVLLGGAVPMEILNKKVDLWIQKQLAKSL